ncbi:MAG: 2-oxo acid dehydrogenase subunit E2 [Propionibacteriaceae bacterium]|nr:2-oxo acid dehydrogenase subunit E2 [Propionibacteriaceae bacterium]
MAEKPGKRRRGDRYDATYVPGVHDLTGIMPFLMRGRNESVAYIPIDVDAEPLLAYIAEHKGTDKEITMFQAVLLAFTKTLRERPTLNRYIIGRRLYQRRNVVFSFIARRQMADDATETNVLVNIKPDDDRTTIIAKLKGEITVAKSDEQKQDDKVISAFMKLPRWTLRLAVTALDAWDFFVDTPGFLRGVDPLRCSIYVANLGSVGLNSAPYHHLYEWGTCSIFVAIGKLGPQVVVGEDGQPAVRQILPLRVTFDERIADGYYDARALELVEDVLANPSLLDGM